MFAPTADVRAGVRLATQRAVVVVLETIPLGELDIIELAPEELEELPGLATPARFVSRVDARRGDVQ
jgi:hypothetical protein